jgi:hypothetical protein
MLRRSEWRWVGEVCRIGFGHSTWHFGGVLSCFMVLVCFERVDMGIWHL